MFGIWRSWACGGDNTTVATLATADESLKTSASPTTLQLFRTEESMAPADQRSFGGCFDCAPSEQLNDPGAWHSLGIIVARSGRELEELVGNYTRPFQIHQYKPIGGPVDRATGPAQPTRPGIAAWGLRSRQPVGRPAIGAHDHLSLNELRISLGVHDLPLVARRSGHRRHVRRLATATHAAVPVQRLGSSMGCPLWFITSITDVP